MLTATDKVLKLAVESTLEQFIQLCEESCVTYERMPVGYARQRMQLILQTLHSIGVLRFPHVWDLVSPQAKRDEADLKKLFEEAGK